MLRAFASCLNSSSATSSSSPSLQRLVALVLDLDQLGRMCVSSSARVAIVGCRPTVHRRSAALARRGQRPAGATASATTGDRSDSSHEGSSLGEGREAMACPPGRQARSDAVFAFRGSAWYPPRANAACPARSVCSPVCSPRRSPPARPRRRPERATRTALPEAGRLHGPISPPPGPARARRCSRSRTRAAPASSCASSPGRSRPARRLGEGAGHPRPRGARRLDRALRRRDGRAR